MPLLPLRRGTALNPAFEHPSPGVCSAYNICCRAEQYVAHDPACIPDSKKREATLVYIRLLGYMLTPWFTNDGMVVATVVTAITSSQRSAPADGDRVEGNSIDITALSELGQFYVNFFIRPCEYLLLYTKPIPDMYDQFASSRAGPQSHPLIPPVPLSNSRKSKSELSWRKLPRVTPQRGRWYDISARCLILPKPHALCRQCDAKATAAYFLAS